MEKLTAAIYSRVSKRGGSQDAENQLAELRRYCRKQGWQLFREYTDHESGSKPKRPAFDQMFEDARLKRFDVLVFWSLDRLSREGALPTLTHLGKLNEYGVRWLSLKEEYLNTLGTFADGVISILSTIAKQERTRIVERTLAGLARAAKEGRYPGRPPLVVNVDRLRQLRDQGLSLRQIGAKMRLAPATVMKRLAS